MGTFLQKTQPGSSKGCKNSISASTSLSRHSLGNFHDLDTRSKGGCRLLLCDMNYRFTAYSKQLLTSFYFHHRNTKVSAKHSYFASQPQGPFHEPMTYYRNLSTSRKIIEPGLNTPEKCARQLSHKFWSVECMDYSMFLSTQLVTVH